MTEGSERCWLRGRHKFKITGVKHRGAQILQISWCFAASLPLVDVKNLLKDSSLSMSFDVFQVAISNPALLDPSLCPPQKLVLHLYGRGVGGFVCLVPGRAMSHSRSGSTLRQAKEVQHRLTRISWKNNTRIFKQASECTSGLRNRDR